MAQVPSQPSDSHAPFHTRPHATANPTVAAPPPDMPPPPAYTPPRVRYWDFLDGLAGAAAAAQDPYHDDAEAMSEPQSHQTNVTVNINASTLIYGHQNTIAIPPTDPARAAWIIAQVLKSDLVTGCATTQQAAQQQRQPATTPQQAGSHHTQPAAVPRPTTNTGTGTGTTSTNITSDDSGSCDVVVNIQAGLRIVGNNNVVASNTATAVAQRSQGLLPIQLRNAAAAAAAAAASAATTAAMNRAAGGVPTPPVTPTMPPQGVTGNLSVTATAGPTPATKRKASCGEAEPPCKLARTNEAGSNASADPHPETIKQEEQEER